MQKKKYVQQQEYMRATYVAAGVVVAMFAVAYAFRLVARALTQRELARVKTTLTGSLEMLDVRSAKVPVCRVREWGPENDATITNTPRCIDAMEELHGYNPSVADEHSLMIRLSPYNFCTVDTRTPLLALGSRAFRRQSVSVWLRHGAVHAVVYDSEDARPFAWRGVVHCAFTRARMLGTHMVVASIGDGAPYREVPLRYEKARRYEKNWVVNATRPEALYMSYSLNPHVVLRVDVDTGECAEAYRTENPAYPKGVFRGGSQLVECEGRLVGVLHRTRSVLGWPGRVYDHALYATQAAPPFALLRVSEWFRFAPEFRDERDAIQFCCGCALSDDKGELIISYGVSDCIGRVLRLPVRDAMAMLDRDP